MRIVKMITVSFQSSVAFLFKLVLTKFKFFSLASTYVKVVLQEQGRNIKCRKTRLIRWGSVPIFDDVFVVTIPENLLSQISFALTIVARGRLGKFSFPISLEM